jgi:N-acetylneuraminic acid mutarotase
MKSHGSFSGAAGHAAANRPSSVLFLFQLSLISTVLAAAGVCMKASAQPNEWIWTGGSNTANQSAVYGTKGVSAAGNIPGGTAGAAGWTDLNGNFWLLAGNDLWMLNPSTLQWTWMNGSGGVNLNGVYGTLGVPAAGNQPGSRENALSWTDSHGNLWLFGGAGYDSNGGYSQLNDFWEFNSANGEWLWMAGSSTVIVCGITGNEMKPIYCPIGGTYGTLGVPAAGNLPGARESAVAWTDKAGNFWTFGGVGAVQPETAKIVNELWEYIPSTGEWGWMGGCSSGPVTDPCPIGVYGALGKPSPANIPGARSGASGWTDSNGNLWLFGGSGYDSAGNQGTLNDLWEFDPDGMQWTWMGGESTLACTTNASGITSCAGQPGVYGTQGIPASGNYPGARSSAMTWTDNEGNFWLFGGNGYDSAGTVGELNDLWELNPVTLEWAWMAGTNTIACTSIYGTTYCGQPGAYGELGIASVGNTPGGRDGSVGWKTNDGGLWLFGGEGYDSVGTGGSYSDYLNDLWEFQPSAPRLAVATPTFSPAAGTYTSVQMVTISDSTPNATIYYTTDGSAPTINSSAYTSAISVSSTETMQAMASAPGYSNSVVASANYTINLPPTFDLAMSSSSLTILAGGEGTMVVTIQPQNGFNGKVSFACSGVPSGSSCTFTPATVMLPGTASTTLTISSAAQSAALNGGVNRPIIPGGVLALAMFILGRKRSRASKLMAVFLLAAASGFVGGCGSSSKPARQPVTSTVTVTASSVSAVRQATFVLTVD